MGAPWTTSSTGDVHVLHRSDGLLGNIWRFRSIKVDWKVHSQVIITIIQLRDIEGMVDMIYEIDKVFSVSRVNVYSPGVLHTSESGLRGFSSRTLVVEDEGDDCDSSSSLVE